MKQLIGIVLRKKQLQNADSVVDVFTSERGRLRIIVKGLNRLSSKRKGFIQSGNIVSFTLSQRSSLPTMGDCNLISSFQAIRSDLTKTAILYSVLIVLYRLLPEDEPEEDLYLFTRESMAFLARNPVPAVDYLKSTLGGILEYLGYHDPQQTDVLSYSEELINAKLPFRDII